MKFDVFYLLKVNKTELKVGGETKKSLSQFSKTDRNALLTFLNSI